MLKKNVLSLAALIALTNLGCVNAIDLMKGTKKNDYSGHWAESQIIKFIDEGIIGGYSDGSFRPNNSITRAEFVTILNNYFGLTNKSGKVFNDTKDHWAKDAIDIAVTNGVTNGMDKNSFKPSAPITREQASVMISNYKKLNDDILGELSKFKDNKSVSSWAKSGVEGMLERGYMGGYSDGKFKPKDHITRAEAVATLSRIPKGQVPEIDNSNDSLNNNTSTDNKYDMYDEKMRSILQRLEDEGVIITEEDVAENTHDGEPVSTISEYDNFLLTGKDYVSIERIGYNTDILIDKETYKIYSFHGRHNTMQEVIEDEYLGSYKIQVLNDYLLNDEELYGYYDPMDLFKYYEVKEKRGNEYVISATIVEGIRYSEEKFINRHEFIIGANNSIRLTQNNENLTVLKKDPKMKEKLEYLEDIGGIYLNDPNMGTTFVYEWINHPLTGRDYVAVHTDGNDAIILIDKKTYKLYTHWSNNVFEDFREDF